MIAESLQLELERFRSLSQAEKLIWLTRLLHFISMAARDTYEVGANGVTKPVELRRFNELIHRVASFQKTIIIADVKGMPDADFFELLGNEFESLNIRYEEVIPRLK